MYYFVRHSSTGAVIKYYTTFSNTIYDVLSSRSWKEVRSESDWDIVWADREWVYQCFDKVHLEPWQRMNHFRNGRELCRKDLMAKNIKRQRRLLEKESRCSESTALYHEDICPFLYF